MFFKDNSDLDKWSAWFAWMPVYVKDGFCWFETVERNHKSGYDGGPMTHYRRLGHKDNGEFGFPPVLTPLVFIGIPFSVFTGLMLYYYYFP